MEKESTAFRLSPKKLAHVLRIGSGSDQSEIQVKQEQKKAELLHDRLDQTLRLDPFTRKALPANLGQLRETIGTLSGEPIGKLLKDPDADIPVLRKIKDYGKKLSTSASSEAEYETANAIYYAAIASSLVFHDLRITKFSYEDLHRYLGRLSKEKWIPSELRNLFTKAVQRCKNKA